MTHLSAHTSCISCGSPIDPNDRTVLREVVGFSEHRDQGGQNHVLFRRETGRLLCHECATRRRHAGHERQVSMLDG